MKSIELTAYAVREYDIKYTVVLDDNDPIVQELLTKYDITFEQLGALDYHDYRDMWDTLMTTNDIWIDSDESPADERFVDFEAFISENK